MPECTTLTSTHDLPPQCEFRISRSIELSYVQYNHPLIQIEAYQSTSALYYQALTPGIPVELAALQMGLRENCEIVQYSG
jgi:hypothetical protein